MQPKIFLAVPSYDGKIGLDTVDRLYRTALHPSSPVTLQIAPWAGSLLPDVFNTLWSSALDSYDAGRTTHFAMVHTDVIPDQHFLSDLLGTITTEKADLVSVVIPLKNNLGLTSTAIGSAGDDWLVYKRLTMNEIYQLPPVFDNVAAGYPNDPLLVNTGCWICDLSKPWTRNFCFNLHSRIEMRNGRRFVNSSRSEDWELSRHVFKAGGKVLATREVGIYHAGNTFYGNQNAWGTAKIDPNATPYSIAI